MAMERLTFGTWDYVIFCLILVISTVIGCVMAILQCMRMRKAPQDQPDSGPDRSFQGFPAVLSICASLLAANFILGSPAEMYYFGTSMTVMLLGFVLAIPTCLYCWLTWLYDLGFLSVFDYVGARFGRRLRALAVLQFALAIILFLGVSLYTPSLAFSQVSNISLEAAILGTGLICTIYTAAGGLKGVLWIDTVQMLIIIVIMLVMVIMGSVQVGGLGEVWRICGEGGRLQWVGYSADPRERHTFWTQLLGGAGLTWALFSSQVNVQKFMLLTSRRSVQITMLCVSVVLVSTLLLVFLAGLVIYANYVGCDPLLQQLIGKGDQLLPFYALDLFQSAPGVTGLFMAALYGAALSSVAAGINALAALTMLGVVRPLRAYCQPKARPFSPAMELLTFKGLTLLWGIITIAVGFIIPLLGAGIIQLSFSLLNISGGPLAGIILLGAYFPAANEWGALAGLGCSLALTYLIAVGASVMSGPGLQPLNITTHLCEALNATHPLTTAGLPLTTTLTPTTTMPPATGGLPDPLRQLFSISYMWYAVIGMLVSLIVGLIISYLTGGHKMHNYEPRLVRQVSCFGLFKKSKQEKDKPKNSIQKNGVRYIDDRADGFNTNLPRAPPVYDDVTKSSSDADYYVTDADYDTMAYSSRL